MSRQNHSYTISPIAYIQTDLPTKFGCPRQSGLVTTLEAKIVLSDHVVISLGTEFIENEKEDVEKQDCELNAAKSLMEKIKQDYPRLPICIQGDALYAAESIMELCSKKYNWKYLFIQKSNRQKLLHESYEWLKNGGGTEQIQGLCKEKGTGCYANHVEEVAGKEEVMKCI